MRVSAGIPGDRTMNRPASDFNAIAAARANYPALERWTYMDVAGRCVFSRATRATLDEWLDGHMLDGADKKKYFEMIERTRGRFATLVNAAADEIAYAKNVSEGINMIATAFAWKNGEDRKSTRLNSSHLGISYAVFCLK